MEDLERRFGNVLIHCFIHSFSFLKIYFQTGFEAFFDYKSNQSYSFSIVNLLGFSFVVLPKMRLKTEIKQTDIFMPGILLSKFNKSNSNLKFQQENVWPSRLY